MIDPCRVPGCRSEYAGPHDWHTWRVVQLTPTGDLIATLITGCSAREARKIREALGDGFHVRPDPVVATAAARAA